MARGVSILLFKTGTDRQEGALRELSSLLGALMAVLGRAPTKPPDDVAPTPVPPVGPPGGGIETRYGTAPDDLSGAIRRYFPESEWRNAAEVSYLESGHWSSRAVRDTRYRAGGRCGVPIGTLDDGTPIVSEWSIGYFQINACAHGGDFEQWSDADNNVRKAAELWRSSGWRPWFITARTLHLL